MSNKKLRLPTTYGVRMSTVLNTDRENPPTTGFSRASKRSARNWERTCDEESQDPYNGYDDADEGVNKDILLE
jgi:hypothetical protein